MQKQVETLTAQFNIGTSDLIRAMTARRVGRKFTIKGWETRFNRALYEVQVYYAARIPPGVLKDREAVFIAAFESLCLGKPEFIDSIEASTKNINKYVTRFSLFRDITNRVLETNIQDMPVPTRV